MPAWRGWGRVGINRRGHFFWGLQMSSGVVHSSVPAEWNMPRAVATFLHQGLVELSASTRVNSSPAIFTVILQTGNISTEKWSKFPPTTGPLTFITQLVIQDIWLNLHPFIYLSMLQLNKAGTDSSYVTLLIRKCDSSSSFWVFELWVSIDSSIADASVQPIHYHRKLHSS